MTNVLGLYNYWVVIILMMTGFYIIMARHNLIKKVIGLNILQASVILLYVSLAKVRGGTAAILLHMPGGHGEGHDGSGHEGGGEAHADAAHEAAGHLADVVYSNPLPHVLMLTAIVVGVATTALALALIVRIKEAYGTVDEDQIRAMDARDEALCLEREAGP